ncbi:hypothetical protein DFJ73DRAFT_843529 [Zopfochytrium polystomum]|nr:hypothetical protein DFJ73DRAFT_843529 [Zopfochytrium polystomum]
MRLLSVLALVVRPISLDARSPGPPPTRTLQGRITKQLSIARGARTPLADAGGATGNMLPKWMVKAGETDRDRQTDHQTSPNKQTNKKKKKEQAGHPPTATSGPAK